MSQQLPAPNAVSSTTLCAGLRRVGQYRSGQSSWTTTLPAPASSAYHIPVLPLHHPHMPHHVAPDAHRYRHERAYGGGLRRHSPGRGDHLNNRVLIWNTLPTSMTAADVVVGRQAYSNSFRDSHSYSLRGPNGVCSDGMLFIADTQNDRVLIYIPFPRPTAPRPTSSWPPI